MEWISLLENHPGFSGFFQSKKEGSKRTMGKNHLAVHGGDLFFTNGKEIRHVSLRNLKKFTGEGEKLTFQELVLDFEGDSGFDISQIILNKSGQFLLLVGRDRLAVVRLQDFWRKKGFSKRIPCKAMMVATDVVPDRGVSVVKAEWHPLGENGTHLVLLTSDNTARVYDIALDADHRQQEFSLLPKDGSYKGSVTSFTFGKTLGWDLLSLYYVTEKGSVFTLCPFIPAHAIVPEKIVPFLRLDAAERYEREASEDDKEAILDTLDNQKTWLQALKITELDNSSLVVISTPDLHLGWTPVPQRIYYDIEDSRSDISDVSCLKSTPRIVLVGARDGRVSVFLSLEDNVARWSTTTDVSYLAPASSLIDYELIDLGVSEPNQQPLLFVNDELKNNAVYCFHSKGAHHLEFPWVKDLAQYLQDNSASARGKGAKTVAMLLSVKDEDFTPLIGFAVVANAYLGFAILTLSSNHEVLAYDVTLEPEALPVNNMSFSFSAGKTLNKKTPLSPLIARLDQLSKHVLSTPPALKSGEPVDVVALDSLATQARKFNQEYLAILHKANDEINARMEAQDGERESLLQELGVIKKEAEQTTERHKKLLDRMAPVEKRDQSLNQKVDLLAQMAIEYHFPEVTKPEREYFQELEEIRGKVALMPDRIKRINTLLAQKRHESAARGQTMDKDLSSVQVDQIQQSLETTTILLSKVKDKLGDIQARLDQSE